MSSKYELKKLIKALTVLLEIVCDLSHQLKFQNNDVSDYFQISHASAGRHTASWCVWKGVKHTSAFTDKSITANERF